MYAEVRRNKRVNGQREITLSFLSNQINEDFIDKIEFGWKLLFKGEWYTIIAPAYQLDGDKTSVSVDAVLSFFVDLNGHYLQDEVENKSFTPASFFSDLFTGTGYSFVLVDSLGANTFNYQRNQSKTERFLYAIDRFKGEYTIKGKVAYIYSLAGSDKDIILHDDLNIQDARVEVDASGFHTYAKGYGDLDESKEDADYELEIEYESPLISKYGKIEGPALYDGSFKHEPALHEAVKQRVENSYSISTTITPVDLTNNGYPEMQLEEGDRVYLHIDRLDLNQQVRVIEIEESFDVEGNIIDVQYTLGNESIAKRYKTQQYSTLKDFQDIIDGNKKIESSWLDEATKRAADIINGNLDSHFRYGAGEIIGINRSNPNEYMRFNTDGIGFSRNGGKDYTAAITYEGIVADAINVGTLRGILIEGVEIRGSLLQSLNSSNTYWDLDTGNLEMENATFTLGNGAIIRFDDRANQIIHTNTINGATRTSGFRVSRHLTDDTPVATVGTSNSDRLIPEEDNFFTGLIVNTYKREADGGYSSNLIGRKQRFSEYVGESGRGVIFDFRNNKIIPHNESAGNMSLGDIDRSFRHLYLNSSIQASDSLQVVQRTHNEQGFLFYTTYGNQTHIDLIGLGAGSSQWYRLGRPNRRFSYIYLANQPDVSSDERLKTDIKNNELGLEFINDVETKSFNALNKNPRDDSKRQYGIIAQQLEEVLIKNGVDVEDSSMVSKDEGGYMGVQYTQLIAPLIKSIQEIYSILKKKGMIA